MMMKLICCDNRLAHKVTRQCVTMCTADTGQLIVNNTTLYYWWFGQSDYLHLSTLTVDDLHRGYDIIKAECHALAVVYQ